MKTFLKNNALSLVFLLLFVISIGAQVYFGIHEYNDELSEEGGLKVTLNEYLTSGHFYQSTFENWESEFLQMALFVWLTIYLRQKGSSESKSLDKEDEVDREPSARRKGAPWPVKKGGIWLKLYRNSLTISFVILFIISFGIHFCGSRCDENVHRELLGEPKQGYLEYLGEPRFWFESFQNWQSEFLSVFSVIVLSIFLRQHGSSQSKPVDAPNDETGE